jgi:hypothetical protein
MIRKIVMQGGLFFAVSSVLVSVCAAQDATTGSISGTIKDPSGALIKGATVSILNTDRNAVERTIMTNNAGFYTAGSLPLGHYVVKVEDAGFKTESLTGIELHVGDTLTVNSQLTTGSASDTVSVNAEALGVNVENATSAGLIDSTQIKELVMVSRNYESLINLQPGVAYGNTTDNLQRGPVGVGGASSVVNFSVNGGRDTTNNWTIDGADNLDRGANLTIYVYPGPDAIAEFKTLRGQYSAEYGRNASGQVDVVTKSGANTIHGSVYEYLRNDFFDANNYYNNYVGARIGKYRYNDYGFDIGGPVVIPKVYNGKDKTFFFVSENWLKEVLYASGTALVPTAAERAGNFTNEYYQPTGSTAYSQGPINVCTAYTTNPATQVNTCTGTGTQVTGISPTAAAYLKDIYANIPLPNSAADIALGLDPHTINTTLPNRYPNLDSVVRIDQRIGSKLNVFYRYIHDTFDDYIGAGTFSAVPIPGVSPTSSKSPGTQHLAKGTYLFSPTLVMNIGYAYSNGSINTVPLGNLLQTSATDIKASTAYPVSVGLVPTISVTDFQPIAATAVYNDHGINHQGFGDVTKTLGRQVLKAGASYSHYEKQENSTTGNNQGAFSFTSDASLAGVAVPLPTGNTTYTAGVVEAQAIANFLTGNANSGFSQGNRNPNVDINQNIYEAYFQDNWKVKPRLTLNIGVRYGYVTPPQDFTGFQNNFDPDTYSASKAPTIAANGLACFTGVCNQTGGAPGASTVPNGNADYLGVNYLNGLIFANPGATNNSQSSPYGKYTNTMQKTDIAPRLGFAWDVFGNGKAAFRGGYGWVYDELEVSYWETTDFTNPPAIQTYTVAQTSLDNPTGGGTTSTPSATPGRIQALPLHAATPYIQQYSLDLQEQFTPSLFVDLGFFGTHGTHLAGAEEINQPKPGAWQGVLNPNVTSGSKCLIPNTTTVAIISSGCELPLNQIKPYLGYFSIDAMRTIFSSNYNAAQLKITQKFKGISYIDGNFTWSRDLTNSPADYSGFIQNIYNPNGDYGRASDDRKLILTIDGVYDLPWYHAQKGFVGHLVGGWEISGIYSAASGLPITVAASSSTAGAPVIYNTPAGPIQANASNPANVINDNAGLSVFGNTNAGIRLNQVSDPNTSFNGVRLRTTKKPGQTGAPSFNTAAFEAQDPTSAIAGTAKRGTINGPGYQTMDVGIFRNFRIYDRLKLQFRAESFNVANHTNINTYTGTATSSLFGTIPASTASYRDPRMMQFGLRLDY